MAKGLRIAGHPVHPMIIPFPIAFLVSMLVCDVVFLVTGNVFWYQVAYVCAGGFVVTGLAAAGAGLLEYRTIPAKLHAKQTATVHMLVNLGAWALVLVGFIFRSAEPGAIAIPDAPPGGAGLGAVVFLSAASVALLAVGGWLGGHLVYVHGVGISQHAADTRHITQGRVPDDQWRPKPRQADRPESRDEAH